MIFASENKNYEASLNLHVVLYILHSIISMLILSLDNEIEINKNNQFKEMSLQQTFEVENIFLINELKVNIVIIV